MALTFFQRMRVAWRGWTRRREDEAKRRNEEFLKRNVSWGQPPAPSSQIAPDVSSPVRRVEIDLEGLQVAYLDDSGQIAYYLDTRTGDVFEARDAAARADVERGSNVRRVPARSVESDREDQRAFIATLEESPLKTALTQAGDAQAFRRALSSNRTVERAWYNFKNERATRAIESWLRSLGLK